MGKDRVKRSTASVKIRSGCSFAGVCQSMGEADITQDKAVSADSMPGVFVRRASRATVHLRYQQMTCKETSGRRWTDKAGLWTALMKLARKRVCFYAS